MSWISKNYEKAALGGSVVVALGLAWLGWSKMGGIDQDFGIGLRGTGNHNTAVANAELIPKARQSLRIERVWKPELDGDRPVDLFTGIPLFISSSAPDKPIDLLKDAPVHPPITNTWWIEHRLDPGYADSPQRDADGDGFSNLEEFLAGTDPNDPESHPPLIAKLSYARDVSLAWVLRPGFRGDGGTFPMTYEDDKGRRNRASAARMIEPDEIFFETEPAKERFKLLGHEVRKELNPRINVEMEVTMVMIEDQRHNKQGRVYEFPSPLPDDDRKNEYLQYDRTAVLTLEAIGLEGTEFEVEENTTFALPPDAPDKNYLLKTVTPEEITVEYTDADGNLRTVQVPQGGFPSITP